ncbi:hypothetical protein PNV01_10585 [Turicibacter sanguinis]|uniref:hypothetical protein n=1 Tax=Turicibacter sanguinis TaxID=154288 RepID=UPI00232BE638|nr:hypothetical protein [Turicibacter sanguinis]MDB8545256.1 hypothetical protein [Turicibacter sanguinis]
MENLKNNLMVEEQDLFGSEELELDLDTLSETSTSVVNEHDESLNMEDFVPLTPVSKERSKGGVRGGLSIVNAKTGQRISLCSDIWDHLGNTKKLQFKVSKNQLLVSSIIDATDPVWDLTPNAKKAILYKSNLVNSLTQSYNLDFSNKSSLSFNTYKKTSYQGKPVVLVDMH